MHFELKIELLGVKNPIVWRQISVPHTVTFHDLHLIIQSSFGWRNSHLYQFSENGFRSLIAIYSPYDDEGTLDATTITIESIFFTLCNDYSFNPDKARKLRYIYDYGDHWEHAITVVGFSRDKKGKAQVLDGGGACPPEDCGGVYGFEDLKYCLKTGKQSEIHGESWLPWLEGCDYPNYVPDYFDLKEAKKRILNDDFT